MVFCFHLITTPKRPNRNNKNKNNILLLRSQIRRVIVDVATGIKTKRMDFHHSFLIHKSLNYILILGDISDNEARLSNVSLRQNEVLDWRNVAKAVDKRCSAMSRSD